jgi:hypothetical protein
MCGPGYDQTMIPVIPEGTTNVDFGQLENDKIRKVPRGFLPDKLQILSISLGFDSPLPELPVGLLKLDLKKNYNYPLPDLPSGLQELHIGKDYNHPLPTGLKIIYK